MGRKKPAPPPGVPTPEQIDAALQHEFSVKPVEPGFRHWGIKVPMRFEVKGPLLVTSESDFGDYQDDMVVKVQMGGSLELHLPWDAAEATVFSILGQLYGEQWTRLLMALCSRSPVDYEQLDSDGIGDGVPPEVAQALWRAAHSYRPLWANRPRGYDDHIWGVAPPEGVTPEYPALSPTQETDHD